MSILLKYIWKKKLWVIGFILVILVMLKLFFVCFFKDLLMFFKDFLLVLLESYICFMMY